MIELKGKKAIITGGAGGIGLAAARTFTKAGAEVIIADINETAGLKAAEETGATFIRCDVSNSQDVQKVIAAANGKLDILYNNAGVYWNGRDGRITEIEEDNWEKIIAINSDPDAPIFSIAHYAICGDLNTVIPQMIKAFKAKA